MVSLWQQNNFQNFCFCRINENDFQKKDNNEPGRKVNVVEKRPDIDSIIYSTENIIQIKLKRSQYMSQAAVEYYNLAPESSGVSSKPFQKEEKQPTKEHPIADLKGKECASLGKLAVYDLGHYYLVEKDGSNIGRRVIIGVKKQRTTREVLEIVDDCPGNSSLVFSKELMSQFVFGKKEKKRVFKVKELGFKVKTRLGMHRTPKSFLYSFVDKISENLVTVDIQKKPEENPCSENRVVYKANQGSFKWSKVVYFHAWVKFERKNHFRVFAFCLMKDAVLFGEAGLDQEIDLRKWDKGIEQKDLNYFIEGTGFKHFQAFICKARVFVFNTKEETVKAFPEKDSDQIMHETQSVFLLKKRLYALSKNIITAYDVKKLSILAKYSLEGFKGIDYKVGKMTLVAMSKNYHYMAIRTSEKTQIDSHSKIIQGDFFIFDDQMNQQKVPNDRPIRKIQLEKDRTIFFLDDRNEILANFSDFEKSSFEQRDFVPKPKSSNIHSVCYSYYNGQPQIVVGKLLLPSQVNSGFGFSLTSEPRTQFPAVQKGKQRRHEIFLGISQANGTHSLQ